ncbi:hypothetical protein [Aeromonas salmonicida]
MTELTRRQHYEYMLIDYHWEALESISAGNAVFIADILAAALSHGEDLLRFRPSKESELALLQMVIEELQTPSKDLMTTQVLPFNPIHELAIVAVTRYRKHLILELGGYQTPCTLQVSNDTEKSCETQHVYRVPLISRWISNVRRILRKVAILLGISKFSERDFL